MLNPEPPFLPSPPSPPLQKKNPSENVIIIFIFIFKFEEFVLKKQGIYESIFLKNKIFSHFFVILQQKMGLIMM